MNSRAGSRFNGVQVLRLVAALLVVGTHATAYTGDRLLPGFPVWEFGAIGVPVFFVISGFVMVQSTARHVQRPGYWRSFAARRAIRIVPMYWIATLVKIGVLVVLPGAVLKAALSPESIIGSFFFIPYHVVDGQAEPLLGVGWTLVFEMFFYLLFTVALLVRVDALWLCGGVFGVLSVLSLVREPGWPLWMVFFNPVVLYFIVGIVIGRWVISRSWGGLLAGLGSVVALACAIAAVHILRGDGGSQPWITAIRLAVIAVIVLLAVALEPYYGHRVPALLLFGGAASYSLYLFHSLAGPLVPEVLDHLGIHSAALSVIGVYLVAIAVSFAVYRWVEAPLTNVLQRTFLPRVDASVPKASLDERPASVA